MRKGRQAASPPACLKARLRRADKKSVVRLRRTSPQKFLFKGGRQFFSFKKELFLRA